MFLQVRWQEVSNINLLHTHEGKGDKCIFDGDKMVNNKKTLTGFKILSGFYIGKSSLYFTEFTTASNASG